MPAPIDPSRFFEIATDLLGSATTDGAWVAVNGGFSQVLGWNQNEILSTSLLELAHPGDQELVKSALAGLAQSGSLPALEHRVRCRDETYRCIAWSATTAPDEGLTYWIGRDVTARAATERELRHSEALYRELVQSGNSAILRWRADGTLTFFNDGAQAIFGYTAAEVLGRHVDILVPEQESTGRDLAGLVADIAAHPDRYREHVNENVAKDGRRLWMLWTNKPINDADGNVVEMLAIGSDVTQLKVTEAALRENESRLKTALEIAALGSWEYDPATGLTQGDARCAEMYGTALDEAWTLEQLAAATHPDDLSIAGQRVMTALEAGDPFTVEYRVRRPDGSNRWIIVSGKPAGSGGPDGPGFDRYIGTVMDVSERREAEAERASALERERETAALLNSLLDTAPIGIGFFDPELRFRRVNVHLAKMNGLPIEAHLGRRPDELLTELEGLDQIVAQRRQLIDAGQPLLNVEVRGQTPAQPGVEHLWLESFFPVRVGEKVIGIGAVVQDITERRRAEEQQRREEERKDRFLATLAHELRNPLAPLRSGLDVLRLAPGDAPTRERILSLMERQMAHLVRLVDDLLEVSRIKQGKVRLHIQTCDLRDVVSQAVADSPATAAGDRRIEVNLPDAPVHVRCDEVRLTQVLQNLLSNARKYTFDNGHIWIDVVVSEDQGRISVRDDGVGIPKDDLDEIFEPFHQVSQGTHGGLGIGLTLVRDLVLLFGGSVQANSRGIGHGSEFILTLPLADGHAEASAMDAPRGAATAAVTRRVLVVDDNPDVAEALAMLLSTMGAAVETVQDGRSALQRVSEFRPHVVLLDIGMPDMNGYEVAAQIRSRLEDQAPLLVAVTGWGNEADKARSRAAGFDDHLTKPVTAEVLHRLLATSMPRR